MIKQIKKFFYPFLLLTFPVLIDCLNGYAQKGGGVGEESIIGILYRGIVILFSLQYFFRYKYRKYSYLILISILVFLTYQYLCGYSSLQNLIYIIKILNLYFVLSILLENKKMFDVKVVMQCAIAYGVIASLVIIYCFLFDVGYRAYGVDAYGIGAKGFFIAMNDMGLTILLINVLSCFFYQKTNDKRYLLASLIMLGGSILAATAACLFGSAIIILAFVVSVFFIRFRDYSSNWKLKIGTIFFVFFVLYFMVDFVLQGIQNNGTLSMKYENAMSLFTKVSGRDYLIDASYKVLGDYSLLDWLFGRGNTFLIDIQRSLRYLAPKSVEVDELDLIGQYGILFSSLILFFPIQKLFVSIKLFLTTQRVLFYWMIIGFSFFIGHSFYGGHAYTSPLVLSYLAVYIYLIVNSKKLEYINKR